MAEIDSEVCAAREAEREAARKAAREAAREAAHDAEDAAHIAEDLANAEATAKAKAVARVLASTPDDADAYVAGRRILLARQAEYANLLNSLLEALVDDPVVIKSVMDQYCKLSARARIAQLKIQKNIMHLKKKITDLINEINELQKKDINSEYMESQTKLLFQSIELLSAEEFREKECDGFVAMINLTACMC